MLLVNNSISQDTIRLVNHSFELTGYPNPTLAGWKTMGVEPDVQPGVSGCVLPARDGAHYIGLNAVGALSKGIGQELNGVLNKDSTYVVSMYLAHSDIYHAARQTKRSVKIVNCDKPASLGVIGLNRQEGLAELLAVTTPVTDKIWKRHLVYFRPANNGYNEIGFVVLPDDEQGDRNGNLLIDKVSAIIQIPEAAANTLGSLSGIPLNITKSDLQTSDAAPDTLGSFSSGIPFITSKSDPNLLRLQNPSFDISYYGLPMAWGIYAIDNYQIKASAGFNGPEVNGIRLPVNYGVNFLNIKPSEGSNFAGLIASETGIWTGFNQTLAGAGLEPDTEYELSIDLAFAKKYREELPGGYRGTHYKNPLRLRIWGGTATNLRQELLAQTGAVTHQQWKRYAFTLEPVEGNYNSIFLEAAYISDIGQPYNGNLLLDNCSAIVKITDSK